MAQEVSDDAVKQRISKAKAYTFVMLKRTLASTPELGKRNQIAHLKYLQKLKEEGKLPLYGPLTDNGEIRGICIFNLSDLDAVKKLIEEDPHIKSGHLTYELHPYFGIPGDGLE